MTDLRSLWTLLIRTPERNNMIKKIVKIFIPLLFIDLFFVTVSFGYSDIISYLRYILFDLGISFIVSFLICSFKEKTQNIIVVVFVAVLSIFALLELQFKNFLDTFYSFQAVGNGFAAVTNFASLFIRTIKPYYWFELLAVVISLLLLKTGRNVSVLECYKGFAVSLILLSLVFTTFTYSNEGIKSAYTNHNDYDLLMEKMGPNAFFFNDLYNLTVEKKEEEYEIEVIEQEEETVEEVIEEIDYNRAFDDTKWIETMNAETDETMKSIDKYLMSRSIEKKNDYTGNYEGYNFIYFMVESFDYIAIDPILTPTLYKMYTEGTSFVNHYAPIYACGTGDSEYTGMTGTYPLVSDCTLYQSEIDNHQSLAGLFKNAGYDTYSFHNWTDEFYPRTKVHPNYGIDLYLDYNGLHITPLNGWLSDVELVEKALPYFIDSEHFFTLIVTSAMHFPYDCSTTLGDQYLSEINAVYPDYPDTVKRYLSKSMNFDKSLELLLNELESAGKLENTVIALYGDHSPRSLTLDQVISASKLMDRNGAGGLYKMPFIIYNCNQESEVNENYCSSLDQLPTIANLFNLNYDPRLYAGSDINNGNCTVKFANGDWFSNLGLYRIADGTFTSFNQEVSEEYILKTNTEIKNIKKTNQAMLKCNYYAKRRFVIDPVTINDN